jgi:hypothetical protein
MNGIGWGAVKVQMQHAVPPVDAESCRWGICHAGIILESEMLKAGMDRGKIIERVPPHPIQSRQRSFRDFR